MQALVATALQTECFEVAFNVVEHTTTELVEPSKYDFNPDKDNTAMILVAVIVVLTWFVFRRMFELSQRKADKSEPKR